MRVRIISSILLIAIIVWETLQWSKCPIEQCKACSNKGCIKCWNKIRDTSYDCVAVTGATIDYCLEEYDEQPATAGGNVIRRCRTCAQGYYNSASNAGCSIISDQDCYAGTINTVRMIFKFILTSFLD